ncbi:MAG: hypothetical protein KFW21_06205 [Spirochaetota bacterium]|nr:hypothetical protein [Spirochaetota bacterium]
MTKIILFETNIWKHIEQVCLNKFIHEITLGVYNNINRVKAHGYQVKIICPRFQDDLYFCLQALYEKDLYQEQIIPNNTIIWNSSFIFDKTLIENLTEETFLMSEDGTWVAIRIKNITTHIQELLYSEKSLKKYYKSIQVKTISIRSYEDLVVNIQQVMKLDIDLYINDNPELEQIQENVFIHPSSNIRVPVDFDTEKGKIVIGANTKVTAFTLIEGPVFIGKECLITKAFIRPNTAIGDYCKIAGEVSLTTVCPYSNKSHDGCIALSHIGSWVNLGAGTECATLKYTYSFLDFDVDGRKFPTKMVGCGTIFGDWVSTGVGTILSPATIIGLGASLNKPYQQLPKFIKAFSWNQELWISDKWIDVAQIKMNRKNLDFCTYRKIFYNKLMKKNRKNI